MLTVVKSTKRILGFDVSKVSTGWACLDKNEYYYGKILIDSSLDITVSARKIYELTSFLLSSYQPSYVILEESFLGSNPKVLKSLEFCRSAVKLACLEYGVMPVDIYTRTCRSHFGLDTKESAFDFIVDRLGLSDFDFKADNDITDAMLLCEYFKENQDNVLKDVPICVSTGIKTPLKEDDKVSADGLSSYIGLLFSGNFSRGKIEIENKNKLETIYKMIPAHTTSPLIYSRTSLPHCYIQHISKKKIMKQLIEKYFNELSLVTMIAGTIQEKKSWVHFEINEENVPYFDLAVSKLKNIYYNLDVRQVRSQKSFKYKIGKEYFDKVIVPSILKRPNKPVTKKETKMLLGG